MLCLYGSPNPNKSDQAVKKIVCEFAKIDPRSDLYRYPVDKEGNMLHMHIDTLDLRNIADVMNGVAAYFSGCDGYLSAMG